MKRITLLAVLALMVALAVPVMATDFTWSGELTYGSITDFTKVTDAWSNDSLTVKAAADANIYFQAQIVGAFAGTGLPDVVQLGDTTTTLKAFSAYLNTAFINADIGKALNLSGVTAVATIGWLEPAATSYSLTTWGYESLIGYDPWGVSHDTAELVVGFGAPLSLQLVLGPTNSVLQTQNLDPQVIVNAYGGVGPINYSVAYTSNLRTDYMGLAGASVKWSQAFGDITPAVNAEVSYNMASGATNPLSIGYAATVAYTTMVTVGVGGAANNAGLGNISAQVNFVPMTNLGVDVLAAMNLATGAANLINSIDASVWYKVGAAKFRVGYNYGSTNIGGPTGSPAAPPGSTAAAPTGGAYILADLTF